MTLLLEEKLQIEELLHKGYAKVLKVTHEEVGLKAIICLHDLTLGPTLGGTRIYPYTSWEDAIIDAKRLAKGMTYKSAMAGNGFGGGKSVIIADPKRDKTEELFLAFGHAVNSLRGDYICAEDSGTTPADMLIVSKATSYVVGLPHAKSSDDPSRFTAWGILRGIQSAIKFLCNTDSLEGRTIAIQGLGSVGALMACHLFWAGAKMVVCDVDRDKAEKIGKKYGATVVAPEDIFGVPCDVFAPCAMGGIVNRGMISKLCTKAVAGCANNQLLEDSDADELMRRGILYAPDFVINSGGYLNATDELEVDGYQPMRSWKKVEKIYENLLNIYDIAKRSHISTHAAAVSLVDYRLKYGIGKRSEPVHFHHAAS